jgi:hypothetical protein
MGSWRRETIWAERVGEQAKTQGTRNPLFKHMNNFCISACLATFALGAAAHGAGAGTLSVNGFAIEAPKGCEIKKSSDKQKLCNVLRQDGTELVVSLIVTGGGGTSSKEEVKQALEFFFEIMIEDYAKAWASEAPGAKMSSADLPASRTPRGLTKCKSFTTKATLDGMNTKERGLLCYAYNEKMNTLYQVIGAVQDHFIPADGQKASPGFDKQAAGILATLRAR